MLRLLLTSAPPVVLVGLVITILTSTYLTLALPPLTSTMLPRAALAQPVILAGLGSALSARLFPFTTALLIIARQIQP